MSTTYPSLQAARNTQELMTAVKDLALGLISQAEGVVVMLTTPEGLVARAARGVDNELVLDEDSFAQRVIGLATSGRVIQSPSDVKPPAGQELSAIAIPLNDSDGIFRGVLYLENRTHPRPFSSSSRQTAVALALQIADILAASDKRPETSTEPKESKKSDKGSYGGLILAALVTLVFSFYMNFQPTQEELAKKPPDVALKTLANTFLTSLQKEDYRVAYACLASSLRQEQSLEDFTQALEVWAQQPSHIDELQIRAVKGVQVDQEGRVEVTGSGEPWVWTCVLENDRWRVHQVRGGPVASWVWSEGNG